MFDELNGLPVHVLVVHAVVVLVPACAVGVLAIAVRPQWRRVYGPLAALGATGALVATYIARESGDWLRQGLGLPADFAHGQLGAQVIWFVLPFWALTVALVLLDRRLARGRTLVSRTGWRGQPWALVVVAVLAVVTGLAATAQVVRTGDSGARSVWEGRLP